MFDSLVDRIKQDEGSPAGASGWLIRFVIALVVSGLLFGGLYMVVQHLE